MRHGIKNENENKHNGLLKNGIEDERGKFLKLFIRKLTDSLLCNSF